MPVIGGRKDTPAMQIQTQGLGYVGIDVAIAKGKRLPHQHRRMASQSASTATPYVFPRKAAIRPGERGRTRC
jgi:hypothetical protein